MRSWCVKNATPRALLHLCTIILQDYVVCMRGRLDPRPFWPCEDRRVWGPDYLQDQSLKQIAQCGLKCKAKLLDPPVPECLQAY